MDGYPRRLCQRHSENGSPDYDFERQVSRPSTRSLYPHSTPTCSFSTFGGRPLVLLPAFGTETKPTVPRGRLQSYEVVSRFVWTDRVFSPFDFLLGPFPSRRCPGRGRRTTAPLGRLSLLHTFDVFDHDEVKVGRLE